MIPNYNNLFPHAFPIDRCVIVTRVRLLDEIVNCRPEDVASLTPDIRDFVEYIEHKVSVKSRKGSDRSDPGSRQRIPTRKIMVGKGTPIVIRAIKDPNWHIQSIDFTPAIILYGHNGRILDETEFHWAASYLIEMVAPMLANPADWVYLIPGLVPQSRAYWKEIEIPYQLLDNGPILRAFLNSKHHNIDLPPLIKREGQTVEFADSDRHLRIRGYRKDLQMRTKFKARIVDPPPVLRIEVILKGERLRHFMAHAKWQKIDGVERLVCFDADQLKLAFSNVVGSFKGPILNDLVEIRAKVVEQLENENDPAQIDKKKKDGTTKLAEYMAWVSRETGLSFEDLYAPIPVHKPVPNESKRKSNYRTTMIETLRRLDPISLAKMLDDDAWNNQPAVVPEKTEDFALAKNDWMDMQQNIVEAYSRKATRASVAA